MQDQECINNLGNIREKKFPQDPLKNYFRGQRSGARKENRSVHDFVWL